MTESVEAASLLKEKTEEEIKIDNNICPACKSPLRREGCGKKCVMCGLEW